MRKNVFLAALGGAALLAVPLTAAIRAMTLGEMLASTHDTVLARITAKTTFTIPYPFEEAVWTRLTVEGESLRTGEPFTGSVVFLGSHDPAEQFGTSEMPTLQDTRIGQRAVIFFESVADFPGGAMPVAHNLAYVYRVEDGFGTPVVIGKGEGAAFPVNVKLSDARAQVLAAQQALPAPAGK